MFLWSFFWTVVALALVGCILWWVLAGSRGKGEAILADGVTDLSKPQNPPAP